MSTKPYLEPAPHNRHAVDQLCAARDAVADLAHIAGVIDRATVLALLRERIDRLTFGDDES